MMANTQLRIDAEAIAVARSRFPAQANRSDKEFVEWLLWSIGEGTILVPSVNYQATIETRPLPAQADIKVESPQLTSEVDTDFDHDDVP